MTRPSPASGLRSRTFRKLGRNGKKTSSSHQLNYLQHNSLTQKKRKTSQNWQKSKHGAAVLQAPCPTPSPQLLRLHATQQVAWDLQQVSDRLYPSEALPSPRRSWKAWWHPMALSMWPLQVSPSRIIQIYKVWSQRMGSQSWGQNLLTPFFGE
jgi:hypothetical protein